jgi:hypothetical protein
MKKLVERFSLILFLGLFTIPVFGQQPPRIYFSDLTSGPNTGGENNNGAIVTLTGIRFGSTQGTSTVTVGSGTVAAYLLWSDNKIAVAIGSAAATGNIVVHTGNGNSNAAPFTVRSGNIYCVSTSGNDANAGQFPSSCWLTLVHAKNTIAAGDIAYAENGVSATTLDNYNSALAITSAGTSSSPKALVAYPGATVTIGTSTINYGARTPNISGGPFSYWVIAGMVMEGIEALNFSSNDGWRVVNNEMTCPNGSTTLGLFACFGIDSATNAAILGNYIHDSGTNCGTGCKLYHAVYFGTNSNHMEFGWNTIIPDPSHTGIAGCRALQFNSAKTDVFDLHVHDNLIHDAICDGVNFATVDPSKGPVEAFNNVVYHVGTGPAPSGIESNYACFNVATLAHHITGTVDIYNNTMYDCGSRLGPNAGGMSLAISTTLRNNILNQINSEPYFTPSDGNCSVISGTNNLWYGSGLPPSCSSLTANVNSNPLFVNAPTDLHLQSTSPAINSGVTISTLLTDFDGITRPQGSAYDIGAYEFH